MISTNLNVSVRDYRCPACGHVVLIPFEQGVEGRYHPACVQPPTAPLVPNDWPPRLDTPDFPHPYPLNPFTPALPHYPGPVWHLNACL